MKNERGLSNRSERGVGTNRFSHSPLMDFRREFDRFFDDFWSPYSASDSSMAKSSDLMPACDVEEKDGNYLLTLDMPGVSKDKIKIETVNDQIMVSGERRDEREGSDNGHKYTERSFGSYFRSFRLPAGVDPEKIEANYKDGTLHIFVPKGNSTQGKSIRVNEENEPGFFARLLGRGENKSKSTQESQSNKKVDVA